jgi:hypothetical protein
MEPATLPTRWSARNAPKQACFGHDGTQGGRYVVQVIGAPYDELDKKLASDMNEIKQATLVKIFANMVYCQLGFTAPTIYKASTKDPNIITYNEAMTDTDNKEEWKMAMAQEIQQLEDHGSWEQVPISNAKTKILPLTWVLHRKQSPDGEIKKLKAHICVQGNLQEGDYITFTPVISWISVHIFLVLSITFHWTTCSINFLNAFIQAALKEPVWTHLPQGFLSKGANTCLCMKCCIYGLNYAPHLWWEHILKALKELGLKPSQHDQCLFSMKDLMTVLYVDDAGIVVPTIEMIGEFIDGLKAKGFELTKEGRLSDFLGIKFEEDTLAGSITMTQMGLIKKIIAITKMENCSPNWVPATKEALGIDPEGKPMEENWSYPSIIGMLLYLSTNTRPERHCLHHHQSSGVLQS